MAKDLRRAIASAQQGERRLPFRLNADASTPTLVVGDTQATLVRTGTGDYLVTFNRPFGGRVPIVIGSGAEDNAVMRLGTSTLTAVQILIEDASTNAAADLDVCFDVIGWEQADEASEA